MQASLAIRSCQALEARSRSKNSVALTNAFTARPQPVELSGSRGPANTRSGDCVRAASHGVGLQQREVIHGCASRVSVQTGQIRALLTHPWVVERVAEV